jgi:hypothetical protein
MVSPDYLLRDALAENEVSKIRELAELWENASPRQQEVAVAMIRAVLEIKDVFPLSISDKYHFKGFPRLLICLLKSPFTVSFIIRYPLENYNRISAMKSNV